MSQDHMTALQSGDRARLHLKTNKQKTDKSAPALQASELCLQDIRRWRSLHEDNFHAVENGDGFAAYPAKAKSKLQDLRVHPSLYR